MFHLLPWGHGNSPPFYKRSAAKHTFPTATLPNSILLREYPRSAKSVNNPARAGTPLCLSNSRFTAHRPLPLAPLRLLPSASKWKRVRQGNRRRNSFRLPLSLIESNAASSFFNFVQEASRFFAFTEYCEIFLMAQAYSI